MDRRRANDDFPTPSSLLSDGRRPPLGTESIEARFSGSLGNADGQSVIRDTSCLTLRLDEPFESMLGLSNSRLVLLSVRLSSELALRFSRTSPPPAMMTGLILSRRNGS